MSLVAYGASDSSDESEDDFQPNTKETEATKYLKISSPLTSRLPSPPVDKIETLSASDSDEEYDPIKPQSASTSIFNTLPVPKNYSPTLQNLDKIKMPNEKFGTNLFASLPTPKPNCKPNQSVPSLPAKKTVKILVPPLIQPKEKDDEEPPKKKVNSSLKGSGLFSLLPAPRNATLKETKRSFVPHILTKKTSTPPLKSVAPSPPKVQKPNEESLKLISYADSGDDSEEESGRPHDFFSLQSDHKPAEILPSIISYEDIPSSSSTVNTEIEEKISYDKPLAFVSGFQPSPWSSSQAQPGPSWQSQADQSDDTQAGSIEEDYLSVVEDDLQLDDEALERLCGRRAKKQKQPVEVINLSGAELLPDPKEWLIKQLSQEQPKRRSHSHKKNDGPTSQQRRKHQITYLAFQAKENELELKNQWSQNRVSRKQTQSKYGF